MAKKQKKPARAVATDGAGELKHNPFAALLGGSAPLASEAPPAEASAEEEPQGALFEGKVVVRREKKGRGGKTVTRISGVAEAHRASVASRMKRALGCGASVEQEDVLLQGALVDRAASWLEAEGAKRVSRSD